MILGTPLRDHASDNPLRRMTLDDLFRRALERQPEAIALADPLDREDFTNGAAKRLTYAEADRIVSTVATRLRGLGLTTDALVALQLPNTVESILTLLGVLRAGMIAVPLPLLWRQIDAVHALSRIGARALITCCRIGPVDHGALAMHIAAETFTIRFLCSFGEPHLDGVLNLDDVFDASDVAPVSVERPGNPADHVALVTFDISPDGLVPVARTHAELVAAGFAVALEARVSARSTILGALATSSFAGLATTVVPWLIGGGSLALHQPFDAASFAAQYNRAYEIAVLPGPFVQRLNETGVGSGPSTILRRPTDRLTQRTSGLCGGRSSLVAAGVAVFANVVWCVTQALLDAIMYIIKCILQPGVICCGDCRRPPASWCRRFCSPPFLMAAPFAPRPALPGSRTRCGSRRATPPLAEVLEALGDSFGLQYRSTASLSRRVSGTYEGSLQRVVRRLLDGHDFIMKTGPGNLEVKVYGPVDSGEARLAPNTAPGPRAAQVAPVPKVTTTPHVTTTPQVTKRTRAARRARRGF